MIYSISPRWYRRRQKYVGWERAFRDLKCFAFLFYFRAKRNKNKIKDASTAKQIKTPAWMNEEETPTMDSSHWTAPTRLLKIHSAVPVAHVADHLTADLKDKGSNTISNQAFNFYYRGAVVVVKRLLPTPEVSGSNRISDINGQHSTNCNLEKTK